MPHRRIAVIGMGMMGGSIGLGVRRKKLPYHVIGIGRNPLKLRRAKNLHACNEFTTSLEEGVRDADFIFICTALSVILPTLEQIAPHLKPGAVVTDIGSVKSRIAEQGQAIMRRARSKAFFVPGHPLAGSEKTGVQSAVPELYKNAAVVLTPLDNVPGPVNKIAAFWKSLGARPLIMKPDVHDILVAQTSHLPHVLSGALSRMVGSLQKRDPNTKKLLAGSFKDMTRISDADPAQWSEISTENLKFLTGAVRSYRDILTQLLASLESGNAPQTEWQKYFSLAKESRAALLGPSQPARNKRD